MGIRVRCERTRQESVGKLDRLLAVSAPLYAPSSPAGAVLEQSTFYVRSSANVERQQRYPSRTITLSGLVVVVGPSGQDRSKLKPGWPNLQRKACGGHNYSLCRSPVDKYFEDVRAAIYLSK